MNVQSSEQKMVVIERRGTSAPLFSVCIPQFNRTSFLLKCLESLQEQTFGAFEVCISDGGSTDGRFQEIVDFLSGSKLSFCLIRSHENLQYDPNLRSSMSLAQGRYCLLFGNDDMLAHAGILQTVAEIVERHSFPEVVITNYRELGTGNTFSRMPRTAELGAGPHVAAGNFRNFSFVSGILLDRALAQRHATDAWDGSEMYQMFVGSRIIAEGGRLLGVDNVVVLKDIQIPNETVDSYARKPVISKGWVQEHRLPLCKYGRVAFEAVAPFLDSRQKTRVLRKIFLQVLVFTYPPWLVEYRRVQSLRCAIGIALGMRSRNLLAGLEMDSWTRLWVRALHAIASTTGLLIPRAFFERVKPSLYALAKYR